MRAIAILALLLAGCSSDPWPGRYVGTSMGEASDCDTGETFTSAQDITVNVERDGAGLFINGRCLIRLDELSDRSARVIPASCDIASADGTPTHIEIVSGRAELDGGELLLEYSGQVTSAGVCLTSLTSIVAYRD